MAVPQLENHDLHEAADLEAAMALSLAQSIDKTTGTELHAAVHKSHVHCTACDTLLQTRELRQNQRHCRTLVAVTLMTAVFCAMVVGIVVAARLGRCNWRYC